ANERVLVPNFEAQARQTFANLGTALEAAGLGWEHAIQMTVILTRREDYAALNAIRAEALRGTPVASTVAVARLLRAEMLIEVDLWAVEPDGGSVVGGGAGAGVER
ncbi:MAG: RidA family protein, partial [Chloroflexi bacterium]|nr:RidA family protein [Chloroflexota bacterium]